MSSNERIAELREHIDLKARYFWSFNSTKIELFLSNFRKENRLLGHYLLDILIYYSPTQCQELTDCAIKEIKRQLWLKAAVQGLCVKRSKEINDYLATTLKKTYVFPVSNTDESGVSSEMIEGIYRGSSIPFVGNENYKALSSLTDIISLRPECILFVDDIIGTGNQFSTFIGKTHHFSLKKSIYEYIEANTDIKFYYVVYGALSKSLEELKTKYPLLEIISLELFDETDKITSIKNEYWEIHNDFEEFQRMLKQEEQIHPRKCSFCKDLPVLYGIGRAQNTSFEYYWKKYNDNYNPIMER